MSLVSNTAAWPSRGRTCPKVGYHSCATPRAQVIRHVGNGTARLGDKMERQPTVKHRYTMRLHIASAGDKFETNSHYQPTGGGCIVPEFHHHHHHHPKSEPHIHRWDPLLTTKLFHASLVAFHTWLTHPIKRLMSNFRAHLQTLFCGTAPQHPGQKPAS